jgi:hypothetical protein
MLVVEIGTNDLRIFPTNLNHATLKGSSRFVPTHVGSWKRGEQYGAKI